MHAMNALIRRNGTLLFDPFISLDRFFDNMGFAPRAEIRRYSPLDVEETGDAFRVTAEVPGFRPEEIKVSFDRGLLSIEAERSEEQKDGNHHIRRSGSFRRTLRLSTPIDVDRIEARAEHGILEITLPKAEEARPKQIAVKG